MIQILVFIAFLAVYFLYLAISMFLFNKLLRKIEKVTFLENELMILVPNIFFFAFVFIIGRFINLQLFLISVAFSNIGLLLTVIVWNLIGDPKTPFKEISGWVGYNIGIKNNGLILTTSIVSLLILIAYPIIIGIHFFSQHAPDINMVFVLKYSSILILGTYVLLLPTMIGILTSAYIDEDTRARIFLNQFTGLIAYSLFISLLFWVTDTSKVVSSFLLGNVNLVYNPQLLLILICFPILFLVLPYFIGIQKAKRLRKDFLNSNTKILNRIIETIKLSTHADLMSNIEKLEKEIISEYSNLVNSDTGIAHGLEYDKTTSVSQLPPSEQLTFQYYQKARPYDSRFGYYDFLNSTYAKILELKVKMGATQYSQEDKNKLLGNYTEHFKTFKDELISSNEAKSKTNPALWIGILAILSPLTSQIISEIGQYLINIFKNV